MHVVSEWRWVFTHFSLYKKNAFKFDSIRATMKSPNFFSLFFR